MTERDLTIAEINAYVERAHQMRAEASRDMAVAFANWVRSLFAGVARTA